MDKLSKFWGSGSEHEILLPRNLYVSLIHEYDDKEYEYIVGNENMKVFVVKVSLNETLVNI